MATPYPPNFPMAEITEIIAAVRNPVPNPNVPVLIHDAWVIIGFGLGSTVGGGPIVGPMLTGDLPTLLEHAKDSHRLKQGTDAIPWKTIAQMLLALIAQWLAA